LANGFDIETYPYVPTTEGTPDVEQILSALQGVRRGDTVLLQGPCHNPSGTDLDVEQWLAIADLLKEKGALLFVDIAYQGFGRGLEEDLAPIQAALAEVPEAIITTSCSKNFGLYRERTGALVLLADNAAALDAARSQAASIIRSSYSMPPAHGAAIVGTVLEDGELTRLWQDELGGMRRRLNQLRADFAEAMVKETGDNRFSRLAKEKGMFSLLPLMPESIRTLRDEHAIYMPNSGRTNIAGLPSERIQDVAKLIARQLAG
jgi:aspartate/tyrosine/aromatic aminotransferase